MSAPWPGLTDSRPIFGLDAPAVSADGRYVAFSSPSAALVPGDTNGGSDVFLRDVARGVTSRVSVSTRDQEARGELSSGSPAISRDGRFVAFASNASNLVPNDTNGTYCRPEDDCDVDPASDVFVRDVAKRTTRRVSVSSAGRQGNGDSYRPAMSADGRYVAFVSYAPNLVPGDRNQLPDVFLRDLRRRTTRLISVGWRGRLASADSLIPLMTPSISADGRRVAFGSRAPNLVRSDTNGIDDVFVRDVRRGTTRRVSVSTKGKQAARARGAISASFDARISADGRYVVFTSTAPNLVRGDTNADIKFSPDEPRSPIAGADVFLHDLKRHTTKRVSIARDGAQANGPSHSPSVSAHGRLVAFATSATGLYGSPDVTFERPVDGVVVRDLKTGLIRAISVTTSGAPSRGGGALPAISADGRWVAFASSASDLAAEDPHTVLDVFLRGPLR